MTDQTSPDPPGRATRRATAPADRARPWATGWTGLERLEDRIEHGLDDRPRRHQTETSRLAPRRHVPARRGRRASSSSCCRRTRARGSPPAIFAVTASLLFGVSARLPPRARGGRGRTAVLKRLDHANIFLIIAGTYTPFCVLLLPEGVARTTAAGSSGSARCSASRSGCSGSGAPRWLYVPVYVALGWVAVFYLPQLLDARRHGGVRAGRRRRRALHAGRRSSTASSGRTRARAGSASTRCSTR